jgi:hypothetical protein
MTCLAFEKKVCEDTIMSMRRHCRMPYASGCRRGTRSLTGGEYKASVQKWKNVDKGDYMEW